MKRIKVVVESILIMLIAFCVVFLAINFVLDKRSENNLNQLREKVKQSRLQLEELKRPEKGDALRPTEDDAPIEAVDTYVSEDEVKQPVLDIYKELHDANENFAGWLYVADTGLEYPIMQGPDNKYYLSHNIDGAYDKYGTLIMDDNCDANDPNGQLIIYGHNVNSGKLFGELLFFKEEAYCNYHPQISFDTLYEQGVYTIFSAFVTTVDEAQSDVNLFTSYTFKDEAEYNRLVSYAKEKSLYERDFTPEYGDEILTLVTCEHSNDDGRFVLMAARKR